MDMRAYTGLLSSLHAVVLLECERGFPDDAAALHAIEMSARRDACSDGPTSHPCFMRYGHQIYAVFS